MGMRALIDRVPKMFRKTITFDGTSGNGAVGTVNLGTVTGSVILKDLVAVCKSDLVSGGGGSVSLGTSGLVQGLLATTLATDLDQSEVWDGASPKLGVASHIVDKTVTQNLILTITTAAITGGSIEFTGLWVPASSDGNLS